jgi:hypothetical protein
MQLISNTHTKQVQHAMQGSPTNKSQLSRDKEDTVASFFCQAFVVKE